MQEKLACPPLSLLQAGALGTLGWKSQKEVGSVRDDTLNGIFEAVALRQEDAVLGDVVGAQVPCSPSPRPLPPHSAQHPRLFLTVGLEESLKGLLPGFRKEHTVGVLFPLAMGRLGQHGASLSHL